MKKGLWIVLAVIVVAAIVVVAVLTKPKTTTDEDLKVRVGYKANVGYQVLFVAQDKGLFEKHGVEVKGQTFESTELMLQAVALGQVDATPAGNFEAIAKMDQESPDIFNIYLTLVFDKENAFFSILVPPDSKMKTLADLKGKKVGVLPGATATARLRMCLKGFMDPDEVTYQQLSPRLHLQTLTAGEVDALYTMDPLTTIGQVKGIAKVLIKGPENEYLFSPQATAGGIISSAFVKKNPKTARRFIEAMYEAVDFMRANDAEARRIIGAATKLDTVVADRMNVIGYWKLDETEFDMVKKYYDFAVEAGALEQAPADVRELFIPASVLK